MEKEPLLAFPSPRRKLHIPHFPPPPPLCPLPEEGEVSLPIPLTPQELKDRLIFGPSSPVAADSASSSSLFDALTLNTTQLPVSNPEAIRVEHDLPTMPFQSQPSPSWLLYDAAASSPWHKTNLHRSKTAPAMAVINDFVKPIPKPQSNSQSVVCQAFVLLVIYLSLGVAIYSFNRDAFVARETHPVVDALYFCIVTMCTIGYGDITPNNTATKLFSIMFVLVGFGFIDILLSGMVSYVLDLQENYLLKTVKGDRGDRDATGSLLIDVKKGRMRIRMKVALALGVVVLCIAVGVGVMHFVESLSWLDSFYLSVMSVTTVGYGDRAFQSMSGRIFASIWLLVSTLAVARAFLYLAEARVDKRQRKMAKWVLAHDMTVSEFLAADIDNNGFVSKSEYVIYKLKEMGKVGEKDILEICKQFERLDSGNCGKITLADLMESHS
uniref:Potassium channel domain-containing protein n=1 Tax=Kalanchoe fedtschenkoi TaxID=63787 RepID=A0A7N0T476_KALFE